MEEEFISYPEAFELKQLGFDKPCLGYYNCERDFVFVQGKTQYLACEVPAPAYSQAFRWFREKYRIFSKINVDQTMEPKFCYSICRFIEGDQFDWETIVYNSDLEYTHEKAELSCLLETIKIVKITQNEV